MLLWVLSVMQSIILFFSYALQQFYLLDLCFYLFSKKVPQPLLFEISTWLAWQIGTSHITFSSLRLPDSSIYSLGLQGKVLSGVVLFFYEQNQSGCPRWTCWDPWEVLLQCYWIQLWFSAHLGHPMQLLINEIIVSLKRPVAFFLHHIKP